MAFTFPSLTPGRNRGMYLGILGVSALAFSCSTEFIPEINEKMRLVPFTSDFKLTMTLTMVVDYVGCLIVERVLKFAFSDYKPKDIAMRRPDQLEREERRNKQEKEEELKKKYQEDERKQREIIEALERRMARPRG
jgi:manganese-transporting P-type ATPase